MSGALANGSLVRLGGVEANVERQERDLRELDRENSAAHRRIHEELGRVKTDMATTGSTLEHLVKVVEKLDSKVDAGFTQANEKYTQTMRWVIGVGLTVITVGLGIIAALSKVI